MKKISSLILATTVIFLSSCGGGGGSNVNFGGGDSGGDSSSGGGSSVDGGVWLVQAPVVQNGCGERIAAVTQEFTISSGALVDTSIVTVQGTSSGGNVTAGYSESNGDCERTYNMDFADVSGDSTIVTLTSQTTCASGATCTNSWQGTATRTGTRSFDSALIERVRGEDCVPATSDVGYRPSLFECNGAVGVLLRNRERNNYSVVVRRNGQYNDRDPNNPTCGTNACSPYKTQKKIELPEYQVNCLGDSGYASSYDQVLRISIKYGAQVTNPNDTSQFQQYCIPNVEQSFN